MLRRHARLSGTLAVGALVLGTSTVASTSPATAAAPGGAPSSTAAARRSRSRTSRTASTTSEANPFGNLYELDDTNNQSLRKVKLSGKSQERRVRVWKVGTVDELGLFSVGFGRH
jgi:hypothetical protein